MEWWMLFMLGWAGPAVPAAAVLAPGQDGLTLEPVAVTQVHPAPDKMAGAIAAEGPSAPEAISLMEQSLQPEPKVERPKKSSSQDRSGLIYEPIYSNTSDRIQYQMGSGLGVGVTTDASLAISQSVRLRRGLDVSVYYAHPVEITPREPALETGVDLHSLPAAPSAGIRLEWKF